MPSVLPKRDRADTSAAEVLLHLTDQVDRHALVLGFDRNGVIDGRQMAFGEFDIESRADDLGDAAGGVFGCG